MKYVIKKTMQGFKARSEGKWIKDENSKFKNRYNCSLCNFYLIGEQTKYCENCGAKMKIDEYLDDDDET